MVVGEKWIGSTTTIHAVGRLIFRKNADQQYY